jgi:hypothetical protein
MIASKNELTQQELKQKLHYDPETGVFHWRDKEGNIKKEKEAGCITANGYIHIGLNKQQYKAHRLAFLYMTGSFPEGTVDHINRVKSDNRFSNLREATQQQNCFNVGITKRNKTGFKGVSWSKQRNKYLAHCSINGKDTHLGLFLTAEEAYHAYCKAVESRGDYAS